MVENDYKQMIEDNINLVYKVYNTKFSNYNINFKEDRIQQGILGLCMACKRFDKTKGYKFSTFAVSYIYWYIMNYVKDFEFKYPNTLDYDVVEFAYEDQNFDIIENEIVFDNIMSVLSKEELDFIKKYITKKRNNADDFIKFNKIRAKVRILYKRKVEGEDKNS